MRTEVMFKAMVMTARQVQEPWAAGSGNQERLWACSTTIQKGVVENRALWGCVGWIRAPGEGGDSHRNRTESGIESDKFMQKEKKISKFQELVCVICSSDSI